MIGQYIKEINMNKLNFFTVIISVLLISIFGCASYSRTNSEIRDKPFQYIFEYKEKQSNEIFKKSKLWIAETYNSAEKVITYDDIESGVIKGTAIGEVVADFGFVRKFKYNISIEIKENRVRLQLSNIEASPYYQGSTRVAGIDTSLQFGYDAIKKYMDDMSLDFDTFLKAEASAW